MMSLTMLRIHDDSNNNGPLGDSGSYDDQDAEDAVDDVTGSTFLGCRVVLVVLRPVHLGSF